MTPEKAIVYEYWQHWLATAQQSTDATPAAYFSDETVWYGPHPINTLHGIDEITEQLWRPLFHSFSNLRRRVDILMSGDCENGRWVSSHGYLIGKFEHNWLGIPATGQETLIRYGEFCRVEGSKIVETRALMDIPDVIRQAGYNVFPDSRGIAGFVPPPRTADGIMQDVQPDAETQKSYQLAHDMLFKGLNAFEENNKEAMGLARYWYPDMYWYGPHGIGTTRNIEEFQRNHQMPWLEAFPDRKVIDECPFFAEGNYTATAGWREVIAKHTGTFMGHEATGRELEFRVMDWWRRDGDRLIE
ncbi:MAG: nuclear transport factor 2 family protein, partial [Chloroflexota bacterium]